MIPRTLFSSEHETFRDSVRRFMEAEVMPHEERWQEQGYVDREVWQKAGANGFLCPSMPEEYDGAAADKLYSVILIEEQARANSSSLGFGLHSEIVAPYLLNYGSEQLKMKYLPRMAAGEMIGAIAMSEPGAGSDLQSVKTTATKKGDRYIVNAPGSGDPAWIEKLVELYNALDRVQQRVTVWLRLDDPEFERAREQQRVFALENSIMRALDEAGAGEHDTNALERGFLAMRLVGDDADAIVAVVVPLLDGAPAGSYLAVRRGPAGTGEDRLDLGPGVDGA